MVSTYSRSMPASGVSTGERVPPSGGAASSSSTIEVAEARAQLAQQLVRLRARAGRGSRAEARHAPGITLSASDAPIIVGETVLPCSGPRIAGSSGCSSAARAMRASIESSPGTSASSSSVSSGGGSPLGRCAAMRSIAGASRTSALSPDGGPGRVAGTAARDDVTGIVAFSAVPNRCTTRPSAQDEALARLVDRVVGAQVGALRDDERQPDAGAALLLVRLGDQHEVAARADAAARDQREREHVADGLALHVERAASPDVAVLHDALERVDAPGRRDRPARRPCGRAASATAPRRCP